VQIKSLIFFRQAQNESLTSWNKRGFKSKNVLALKLFHLLRKMYNNLLGRELMRLHIAYLTFSSLLFASLHGKSKSNNFWELSSSQKITKSQGLES